MKYYGFRFFTAYKQICGDTVRAREPIDPEWYGEDYAARWTEHMAAELDEIRKHRTTKKIQNDEKVEVFKSFAEFAYHFAQKAHYDIVISDDSGEYGLIVLHRESARFAKDEAARDFARLVETADEVYIDAEEDLLSFQFLYDLCDIVEREPE